ncbi:MAG: response regulator [Myxococcales bacterium]
MHDASHYFRLESSELVDALERGLLAQAQGSGNLNELFRQAHTLKGAARVVGEDAIADLSHTLEDVLAHHRERREPLGHREISELLRLVDAVKGLLSRGSVAQGEGSVAAPAARPGDELLRIPSAEMDELAAQVLDTQVHATSLRKELKRLQELRTATVALVRQASGIESLTARVRAGLEDLISGMNERHDSLRALSDQLELDLRQLTDRSSSLRLLELSGLLAELERSVHDTAQTFERSVAFTHSGLDVRVDGPIYGLLRVALGHLARNAVAHGIEAPELRRELGKPSAGSVHLAVQREGNRLRVTLSDDGRGIDRDAVTRAAERMGLPVDPKADPREVEAWIFAPGLSTASRLTDHAGRGVGLDAVRDAIERCKGSVRVESTSRIGTRFELIVPVSVTALTTLSIEVSGATYLVPLHSVRAACLLGEADVVRDGDRSFVMHQGEAIPLRRLTSTLTESGTEKGSLRAVVVVEARGQRLALGVGAIRSTRDVIVRSLPKAAGQSSLFLGAAFDESGHPELVLSTDALGSLPEHGTSANVVRPRRKPVLVIDDSLTTRMLEQSILDAAGYEVELASSAEEGLDKALALDFGLIIVDVEMPGMNGYQFTRAARGTPKLKDLPIIMVTSLFSEESRRNAREAGVSAYIVKGEFDQGRFLGRVAEYLP